MQAIINNRSYTMTEQQGLENLKLHLLSRGFDGLAYEGISLPVGRQRKIFKGLFFRSAKTGEFVSAI
jgi:hypothetical protein